MHHRYQDIPVDATIKNKTRYFLFVHTISLNPLEKTIYIKKGKDAR